MEEQGKKLALILDFDARRIEEKFLITALLVEELSATVGEF